MFLTAIMRTGKGNEYLNGSLVPHRDGCPTFQKELAKNIGKSERTIKTRTEEMQEKGLIRRENGKRNGKWEVLIQYE